MKIEFMTKPELKEEIMYLKCDVEAKQKCINGMDKYIKELKEANKRLYNCWINLHTIRYHDSKPQDDWYDEIEKTAKNARKRYCILNSGT